MKKRFRTFSKELSKKENYERMIETRFQKNAEGEYLIAVESENVFSEFSKNRLSADAAEFLEEEIAFLPPLARTRIVYTGERKEEFSRAVEAHFSEQALLAGRKLKTNSLVALGCLILGLMWLAASYFVGLRNALLAETLNIFSWVLVWAAADRFFFARVSLKRAQLRCLRIIHSLPHEWAANS